MEVVKRGIHFVAKGSNNYSAEILFCHKDEKGTFVDGLTNEGMLDIMISRFQFLVDKNPSEENVEALLLIRKTKSLVLVRNQNKIKRRNDHTGNSIPLQATG